MTRWLLLAGVVLLAGSQPAMAETFSIETDGAYRVYIGPDKSTDWVDVCCQHRLAASDIVLEYADYTPIEEVTILLEMNGTREYLLKKGYSQWKLTVPTDLVYTTLERLP